MNKTEFVLSLTKKLNGLPFEEIEDRINFYLESIDDRMEEGLSEEEAVAAVGTVDDIAAEILSDIPLARLVVEKVKPKRRLHTWETLLLCVGSPLWISLLAAALAVVFAVYAALWAVVVSLWATEVAFIASALGGTAAGITLFAVGTAAEGLFLLGSALLLAGLAIPLFLGCRVATKGSLLLTKKIALSIKKAFIRKEKPQ